MPSLAFVLLLLFLGNCAAQDPYSNCGTVTSSECQQSVLDCCETWFHNQLNLNSSCVPIYNYPDCARNSIESTYSLGGTDGLLAVCAEFYKFQTCLGLSWRSCTTDRFFIMQGKPVRTAQTYAAIFSQFNYACGAGMDTFLNKDSCMASVFKNSMDDLQLCRTDFYNNIDIQPDKCTTVSALVHCYEMPFYTTCGLESSWWGCEFERSGIQYFYPECSPHCTVTQEVASQAQVKTVLGKLEEFML